MICKLDCRCCPYIDLCIINSPGERRGSIPIAVMGGPPPTPYITCTVSHNHVFYSGTSNGFIIATDRRNGRPLVTWQGHGGAVIKVFVVQSETALFPS